MFSYIGVFLLAILVAAMATPVVRRLAIRGGAVSVPGGRHIHLKAIPRLGGVAIALAFFTALLAILILGTGASGALRDDAWRTGAVLVGALVLTALGAVDDLRGLPAKVKLLVQVAVAVGAYAAGLRIDAVAMPLIGPVFMGVFAIPITVIWIVGVTNAVNLIDGLDGLAAGVSFFAATTLLVVSIVNGRVFMALMMLALMGALIGFLFYNFNPARIFMGDSGSYFLGYVLAAGSLAGSVDKVSATVALFAPMVALGLPIFDTLLSMLRRYLEKRSIFSPDRGHIHHRLIDMGLTHRRAVLTLYGVCVILTVSAIAIVLGRQWQVGFSLLVVLGAMVGLLRFAGYAQYLSQRRRQRSLIYDGVTQRLRKTLPQALTSLRGARHEAELEQALQTFCEGAGVTGLSWGAPEEAPRFQWGARGASPLSSRELAQVKLPLGEVLRARASITLTLSCDGGELSPEATVLLQLVADSVTTCLEAMRHPLAPGEVDGAPALESDRPPARGAVAVAP